MSWYPLTFILTPASIAFVYWLAKKEHHETNENVEIFRVSSVLIFTIFFGAIFSVVIEILFNFTSLLGRPDFGWLDIIFILMILIFSYSYIYFKKLFIEIGKFEMRIGGAFSTRIVCFKDVKKIVLQEGKNSADLFLFDEQGKKLCSAYGSMQDFPILEALIRARVLECNTGEVIMRKRPFRGEWSEHVFHKGKKVGDS